MKINLEIKFSNCSPLYIEGDTNDLVFGNAIYMQRKGVVLLGTWSDFVNMAKEILAVEDLIRTCPVCNVPFDDWCGHESMVDIARNNLNDPAYKSDPLDDPMCIVCGGYSDIDCVSGEHETIAAYVRSVYG